MKLKTTMLQMDISTINSSIEYKVVDNQNVKLVVKSGDASLLSASSFALEGREERWQLGNQSKLEINIGLGEELKGRRMRGFSAVADLLGGTTTTRINYILSGGLGTQKLDAELPVDKAFYYIEIKFI